MANEHDGKQKRRAGIYILGPFALQVLLVPVVGGGTHLLTESWPGMAPGMRQLVRIAACLVAVGAPMALYFTKKGKAARQLIWGPEGLPWAAARREVAEAREAGATEFEANKPALARYIVAITLLLPGAVVCTVYKIWGSAIAHEWLPTAVCNTVARNLWARIVLAAGLVAVTSLPAIIVALVLKRQGWFRKFVPPERPDQVQM